MTAAAPALRRSGNARLYDEWALGLLWGLLRVLEEQYLGTGDGLGMPPESRHCVHVHG